jgi:polyhydroxybutyrate depolymerase
MVMRRIFRRTRCFFLVAGLVAGCGSAAAPVATETPTSAPPTPAPTLASIDTERIVEVDGTDRTYVLYLPPGISSATPVPVVFAFHGHTQTAEYMRVIGGFDTVAFANGFAMVYPNGTGPSGALSWNAGVDCCGYAAANDVPEADFVRAILADLETVFSVDADRVYATGFSNGAYLSYRLGCEMSDVFAAIAPAAGNFLPAPCELDHPVSLIHFHGLADTTVLYEGGRILGSTGNPMPSVEESAAIWAKMDDCDEVPETRTEGRLTVVTYSGCADGSGVEVRSFEGMAHTWPPPIPQPAAQVIWDFFAAHHR